MMAQGFKGTSPMGDIESGESCNAFPDLASMSHSVTSAASLLRNQS